jgi:AraC family transcriptional regulator
MKLNSPFKNKHTGSEEPFTAGSQSLLKTEVPCPWQHIRVDHRYTPPYDNPELISDAHVFAMKVDAAPSRTEFRKDGSWKEYVLRSGQMGVYPCGYIDKMRSADEREGLFAMLDHAAVAQTCAGFEIPSEFEYDTVVPVEDELVAACLRALLAEAKKDYESGELYGDAIAASLSAHLLFRYATRKALQEPRGGLAKKTLAMVCEYIDEHASERIRLNDLAALAHLSPYHFSRLFKQSTGLSPYQYLMRARVKLARRLINKGDMTLKEVSRVTGFYDSSHFARVFKRVTGVRAADVFRLVEEE